MPTGYRAVFALASPLPRGHRVAMRRPLLMSAALLLFTACDRPAPGTCAGDHCGTIVFAAIGEPVTLLPPVSDEAIDRDIFGQIFLKLADIGAEGNTVGDAGFEPQLADRWSWTDSLTLAFHLNDKARWHDGRPVTAEDVAFTFAATTDTALASPMAESVSRIASVTAQDSVTAVFRFRAKYPEMFYDAAYQMRILPAHLLRGVPLAGWRSAEFGRAPVGNGPYRFVRWTPGQHLELVADSTFFLGRPHIRHLIWRFAPDPMVAVTQLLADEADAIEILVPPSNLERARADTSLALYPYPGSVYMILGVNLRARGAARPHPVLGDPLVRRALVAATDRVGMARNVFGDAAKVPPAPIPQAWTALWFRDLPVPAYDTAVAGRLLDSAGWRDSNRDGIRDRGGRKLGFAIAVPSTSASRKQYAQLIQEQLRLVGVEVTVEQSDMATLQQRLRSGNFDAAIQAWATDPTPSSGIPQMWSRGGGSNFGHYESAAFEQQVAAASHAASPDGALRAWRAAFEILAGDAPAIVLNAPDNVAAIDKRVTDVRLRPDEYWAYVRTWRIPRDRLTERDRQAR